MESLNENRSIVSWFINKIEKLFTVDVDCKERRLSGARATIRVCRSSVTMQEIENKFNSYTNKGSFHRLGKMTQKALNYIKYEWKAMKNMLEFGDAVLSNNLCQ